MSAWDEFLVDWNQLPPLVRASLGVYLAREAGHFIARHEEFERFELDLDMTRRARVSRRFVDGAAAVQRLFTALTIEADSEYARVSGELGDIARCAK